MTALANFLLFTIVYSKINIYVIKTNSPRQYFADAQYRFPSAKALAIAAYRDKFRRLRWISYVLANKFLLMIPRITLTEKCATY